MAVNDKLLNSTIAQAVMLQRFENHEVAKIIAIFNDDILPDLIKQIEKRFGRGQINWTTKRIQAMKDIVRDTLKLSPMFKQTKTDMIALADSQSKKLANALNSVLEPVGLEGFAPSTQALRAMVTNSPFEGATLREWFADLQVNSQKEIVRQMTMGITEGQTVRQMTDRLVGTAANAFTDGTGEVIRRHAATIVRTATNHVNTQARLQTFGENEEVIKGYRFVATLDSKTTEICMKNDGKVFKLDDPQAAIPPLHFNCRSTITPVLKSWKELGIDLKEAPAGTRASFNGQVPSKLTYPEWLKGQPVKVQNAALGVTRAKMWREGKISIDKFTNDNGLKFTLKQLEDQGFDVPRDLKAA